MTDGQAHEEQTLTGPAQPAEEAPAVGQLLVYFEGQLARAFPLNIPVVTIGRTPANALPLPHPGVSRSHAELRVSPQAVILTDMGSANGTWVNDSRLIPQQPVQLVHGTAIRIGPFILRYEAAGVAPTPETPTEPSAEQRVAAVEAQAAPVYVAAPPVMFTPAPLPRETSILPLPHDPVSSYLDFLPAIFQDGDFLGRFLMIFQSIWEPLEYRQDHVDMYFDPRTAPTPFLGWLSDWFGVVGPVTEEGRLRALLTEAVELYRWRGTKYGLTRLIEICTGVTPVINETPADPAILHIRVTLPPESKLDRETIERLVNEHKPAHTAYLLEVFN